MLVLRTDLLIFRLLKTLNKLFIGYLQGTLRFVLILQMHLLMLDNLGVISALTILTTLG